MYLPPCSVKAEYLEPLLRKWLEQNGHDLTKEYIVALANMKIKNGVDVYREFGPCGPFPFFYIQLYDAVTKTKIESPLITISQPTEKFGQEIVVLEDLKTHQVVGHTYTFTPNQVNVPDEIREQQLEKYKVPDCCRSNEQLKMALYY